jgi:hypothetical protein
MTTWTKETGDFDFLNGHFDVHHRTLTKPLTGSDEWQEYRGLQHDGLEAACR